MPIREDRLKDGTLTLDIGGTPVSFATQATNIKLTPESDEDGDQLEVLSGDTIEPDRVTSWVLGITAVQDFGDPAGFVAFALTNDGELATYTWAPQGVSGVSFTGSVTVQAVEIGGEVNKRLTTDAEWPCTGKPTPTYPGP